MRLAFATFSALVLASCTSKPAAAADADKGQLNYKLTTPEKVTVKAGGQGSVSLVLKPGGGAHVDPRAPMAFEVKSGSGVQLAKTSLGHDDGKERADSSVEFQLPFTAKAAGKDEIKVHADFYLCTAKLCERQVADLSVPVVVE